MKHKHILFGLLALMVASCTNDEMNEVAEMKQNDIQVTADFGADTRIDFSEEGNVTHVFWNEGDQITIFDETQGGLDYQVVSVSNGGATANFSAIDADLQETAEGATINAIYPALPVVDGIVKLPNTNVWNEDRLIPYATAFGSISDSKLYLNFFHDFAYLKLTLNAETVANSDTKTIHAVYLQTTELLLASKDATYDFKERFLDLSRSSNSMLFNLNEPFTATGNAEKVIYIPILPQRAGETLTLSILHHDDYGMCDTLLTVSKKVPEPGFFTGSVITYTPKQSFTREGNSITLTEAGTLSQAISEEEKGALTSLKVVGPLNGDDIRLIREMAGVDVDGNATEGVLTYLDISEASIVEGGDYYYFNNGPVVSAIFRCYTSDDIVGDYMFNSTILENVLLPYGVTSIGERAFWDSSSLTSIDISDGVTSIGKEAFRDCSSLTSINIPDGVTTIGVSAFSRCSSLTSIDIPDGVASIDGAFSSCSSLRSFNIPGSVTSIGNFTFYDCSSLTSIIIPDGVTSVGESAFQDCSALTSVTFGNGLTEVGNQAFRDCPSLVEVNISDLSAWCRINFGYNVANPLCQGGKLYLNGAVITEVVIPNDITEIKNYAFVNYSFLNSVVIPDGVTSIGEESFGSCSMLSEVTCNATTPPTLGYSAFDDIASAATLYAPTGCATAYSASDWAQYFTTIEETTR